MKTGATLTLKTVFAGLEKDALDTLRAVAQSREYPPGAVLCRQGELEHTFYVVMEGRVAITRQLESGEEQMLGVRGANQFFGEMGLIDNAPRSASCVTLVPTTVLEVTEAVFDQLVEQNPTMAYTVLRRILDMARDNDRRAIAELTAKNEALEQAYAELKAAQAELVEKERLERELELAAEVQRSLLPGKLPQYADLRFAAYLHPARQVGGDFYDVIPIDEEHVGVLIADVADKGFHAALFMAVGRTLFSEVGQHSLSPATVALDVHESMLTVSRADDLFVTAFYGVLHRPSGRLTYVRAGHERPLLARPNADPVVRMLEGDGRFLGMWPELSLGEATVSLQPGDRLLLYSDGLPDAANPAGVHYGLPRLQQTLAEAISDGPDRTPSALVDYLIQDVSRWQQNADPFDDLTLLIIERTEKVTT